MELDQEEHQIWHWTHPLWSPQASRLTSHGWRTASNHMPSADARISPLFGARLPTVSRPHQNRRPAFSCSLFLYDLAVLDAMSTGAQLETVIYLHAGPKRLLRTITLDSGEMTDRRSLLQFHESQILAGRWGQNEQESRFIIHDNPGPIVLPY